MVKSCLRWNLRWSGSKFAEDPLTWAEVCAHAHDGRCPYSAARKICRSWAPKSRVSCIQDLVWRENPLAATLKIMAPYVDFVAAAKETGKETFFNDAVQNASEALVDILYKNKGEVLKPQYELEI